MSKTTIAPAQWKVLLAESGGICAFRGCNRHLIANDTADDQATFTGEIAHIVADSRQGPRGDDPMDDETRNRASNLLILCGDHHKVIDSQPRTYTVAVLRQMK